MAESDGSCSPVDIPFEASSDEEGSVAAYFPDDFKQYVDTQLNRCPVDDYGWVFWSREDDQSEHPPNFLDLKKKIKDVLRKWILNWFEYPTLFQLWAPTMTMEGRSYLTTQNQPFALCPFDTRIDDAVKGLCGYRMISEGYKFYMDRESSDEQLGVPGRVFKHGFPEFSPNVEYYSIKEYPLRDHALGCQLKLSWAIPLFDPSTHFCVGVLEIVSTGPTKEFVLGSHIDLLDLHNYLEEVGLESSISPTDHVKERNVRQSEALYEIKKVLEVVREVHGLDFAQVWARCRVDCACWALGKGDFFRVICHVNKDDEYFNLASNAQHLRKGQGVVGRAFSSRNVLLCKDVTQLSVIDYPLAHYARYHKVGCCFAICLQSSCTGNDIYLLECFMPPSNNNYGVQQTALRKILETMKKNFRTFKLASGEEVGEHLCIEEISFQMSQTTRSLPMLEPLQSGGEMRQLDLVSGTLKRVCRDYGIPRWPPCKNMVGCSQPSKSSPGVDHQQIRQLSSNRPFSHASAAVVHANPCNTVIRDANIVTVKAKYIDDIIIKFPLSLSSGLVELQQKIAHILHLEDGTYYVKYKDEDDDLIVLACDQDLKHYISTSTSLGSTTIVVFIVPK
ncbi:unnamed protein product [Camellia sinensis]